MNSILNEIIATIENEDLAKLANALIKSIPEYFYHVPASSTGRYHPEYSLGDGGLQRHTVALVRIMNHMFEADDRWTSRERDMLRIAGMMHDTRKSGSQEDYENNKYTKFEHPVLAAEVVRMFKGYSWNDDEIELILHAPGLVFDF